MRGDKNITHSKENLWGRVRCKLSLLLGLIGILCLIPSLTQAKVCFLPGRANSCFGEISSESLKLSETCEGFNLSSPKCTAAQSDCGWNCTKCTNASGNHWKCEKLPVPEGCTPGITGSSCGHCENYTFCGYSGGIKAGRCDKMNDYGDLTHSKPANCNNFSKGKTTGRAAHGGTDETCYWNITPTCGTGVSCTKSDPGGCKTWTERTDGRGTPVYC